MKTAFATLQRKKTSHIDLIRKAAVGECSLSCKGKWLECTQEVHPILFATAVRELLLLERGKYWNVMIVGPTNCGKTFLLRPLELIFNIFSNPAADRYAWVGAEHAEIIFLNDFRWSKELIEWKSYPYYWKEIELTCQLLRITSAQTFVSVKIRQYLQPQSVSSNYKGSYNSQNEEEDDMMASRWKVFTFFHSIPENEQKNLDPCAKCFAKLVLMGEIC
jgi:hypothetical protein